MKQYLFIFTIWFFLSSCMSCSDSEPLKQFKPDDGTEQEPDPDDEDGPDPDDYTLKTATIDLGTIYQEMEGFGASDCWTPEYVGRHWAEDQKESIAKLLFSQQVVDGQPEGIGLSMWRFNVGAGTAEQGDNSDIEDKSRRTESFLLASGGYNWTKQAGQQYFIEKAKSYGCEKYVMFSNSPPVYFTKNGKGYVGSAYSNLKEDCYDDFANYLVEVAEYFKRSKGIEFDFISPVNEPQYNWPDNNDDPSQEGSGWQNSEIKKLAVELNNALENSTLNTQILLAEAGDWTYLYQNNKTGRSDVIKDFFDSSSGNYIGNLPRVPKLICGHSYWTDSNWDKMTPVREQVKTAADAYGLKVYQTEWSMLGDNYTNDDYVGHDNASEFDIAAYMARVIHQDLTLANVSSWSFWTAMDASRWNHKNRFLLINLIPAGGSYADIAGSGTHEDTKTLWVLGNYSLFVRPGYKRIAMDISNSSKTFFGSAYLSPDGNQLVCVYNNLSATNVKIETAAGKTLQPVKQYVTSETQNLEEQTGDDLNIIPANSIVTVIYE